MALRATRTGSGDRSPGGGRRSSVGGSGINARIRCYKYVGSRGDEFGPHHDGSQHRSMLVEQRTVREDCGARSRFSLLIYLNDGFEGGATILMPGGECAAAACVRTLGAG